MGRHWKPKYWWVCVKCFNCFRRASPKPCADCGGMTIHASDAISAWRNSD